MIDLVEETGHTNLNTVMKNSDSVPLNCFGYIYNYSFVQLRAVLLLLI